MNSNCIHSLENFLSIFTTRWNDFYMVTHGDCYNRPTVLNLLYVPQNAQINLPWIKYSTLTRSLPSLTTKTRFPLTIVRLLHRKRAT